MTLFFRDVGKMRGAAMKITHQVNPTLIADANETTAFYAEENWENEGGHLSNRDIKGISLRPFSNEIDRLEAQVKLSANKLTSDFVNGRVGTRYNTYDHRARVLRLQRAELDAMRNSFNDPNKSQ
jgi:hypothetical protein